MLRGGRWDGGIGGKGGVMQCFEEQLALSPEKENRARKGPTRRVACGDVSPFRGLIDASEEFPEYHQ